MFKSTSILYLVLELFSVTLNAPFGVYSLTKYGVDYSHCYIRCHGYVGIEFKVINKPLHLKQNISVMSSGTWLQITFALKKKHNVVFGREK